LQSSPATPVHLEYAARFHCIGSACEDTCCQGWSVPIDRAAWDKYQSLPESPLRVLIDACVLPTQTGADPQSSSGANPSVFAMIQMNGENQCPLLSADHLCSIQSQVGEGFLSYTCATYPRIVASIDGVVQTSLALSCPEAARIVLLTPDLLTPGLDAAGRARQATGKLKTEGGTGFNPRIKPIESTWALDLEERFSPILPEISNFCAASPTTTDTPQGNSPQAWFLPIRDAALSVLRNRTYPLWQRLFLLGIFCRRLDLIAHGELKRSVPAFLSDFEAAVASGALRTSMETLPVDRKAQLDVVLRLAGLMLHKSNVRPRFVECIQAFTAGIGNGPGATLDSLAAHHAFAHDRQFAPFFNQHPHILENFLANTILRRQFPFGKEGLRAGANVEMAHEFVQLTAQFVLMRGLLIGVAGHHGPAFSSAHVVHTVQAASKHFEHHPEFLNMAHALLVERGMDGARGLAILLRNAGAEASEDGATPASPGRPAPEREGERSVWELEGAVPAMAQAPPGTDRRE
jgi:lysine-N-methylase